MTKRWLGLIIAIFLLLGVSGAAFGLEPFQIKTYLTDQAGVLTEAQRYDLSMQLKNYAAATGNQVVAVIIPSLEGEAPEEYSLKLTKVNKLAEKGKDNAALILIAVKERKIRFEVGYGLEGVLPDGKTGAITREEIAPFFRNGDYYSGLAAGIRAVFAAISPDYSVDTPAAAPARKEDHSFPWAFIVALIVIVFSVIGNLSRGSHIQRQRHRRGFSEPWYWGGGGFGGGGFSGGGFSGGDSFSGGGGSSFGSFGGGGSTGGW
ncbi:MAG: TPM domain-containing protein [Bacillota bacterium]